MCMNVTRTGKSIAPKIRNLLLASAVVTGGLLTGSLCKTSKSTEQAKEPIVYEWDKNKNTVTNVIDNAKVTGEHIIDLADKSTDNPVPIGGALALELMGVGLAGAAIKRNQKIEKQNAKIEKLNAEYIEKKESLDEKYNAYLRASKFLKEKEEEVENAKKEYEFAKAMGPYKGSYGYSPDGDHVYGESSSESEEAYEYRLKKLEKKLEDAENNKTWYTNNRNVAARQFLETYDRVYELNIQLDQPHEDFIEWMSYAEILKRYYS